MRYEGKMRRRRHGAVETGPAGPPGESCTRQVRLGELGPGCSGKIHSLSCPGNLRRRLMNMGVVCGTPFEISRVAPLGDPIELKFKDFNLSLRRAEAGDIWVEVEEDEP